MLIKQQLVQQSEERALALGIADASAALKRSVAEAEAAFDFGPGGPPPPAEIARATRAPRARRRLSTEEVEARRANLAFGGARPSGKELERMFNGDDLVDEFYLERALVAARPICRISVRNAAGRELGCATGFMVAPGLLLTNWHVLEKKEFAIFSIAEFEYTRDIRGHEVPSYQFALEPDRFFINDQGLDYALVAVAPRSLDQTAALDGFGYHRLVPDPHKIWEGDWVTIIQHPGGARRQFAIRDNLVVHKKGRENFMWYQSDTAQGSSGAPAFNDSFQVVALHHMGRARRDENGLYVLKDNRKVESLDGIDDSDVVWEANEGLRVSALCAALKQSVPADSPLAEQLLAAMEGEGDIMSNALGDGAQPPAPEAGRRAGARPAPDTAEHEGYAADGRGGIYIPLRLHVSLEGNYAPAPPPPAREERRERDDAAEEPSSSPEHEKLTQPYIDNDYSTRDGYLRNFLGVDVPLPTVTNQNLVSRMDDGEYVIPYEHFSVVMNKARRLALFTASNVDGTKKARRPEAGKDYTRKGLTGLGKNDQEQWRVDDRIPGKHQLPDRFYNKDGAAFDKGHIVRREDVCWGKSYEQIRRANGDTFHTTNCSPQVSHFNRSPGIWGSLENYVLEQVQGDGKYCIFAGPVLDDDDDWFDGYDDWGHVRIQIPKRFWKIVVARSAGTLQAFAFLLEQDLQGVPLEEEFFVSEEWRPSLRSVQAVEDLLDGVSFPEVIKAADQFDTNHGEELLKAAELKRM